MLKVVDECLNALVQIDEPNPSARVFGFELRRTMPVPPQGPQLMETARPVMRSLSATASLSSASLAAA